MTDAEQREVARQFVNRWMNKGKEDEHGRSYWIDLLSNVLEMDNVTERIDFEKKVVVNNHTKRIDAYIPETSVIIEQKSLGIALDQKLHNSGDIDLTPYEQAKRYNDHLPYDERARWIVTSNFEEIWIYDMNVRVPEPLKISLIDLPNKYPLLDFLVKREVKKISNEMEVSIKAGEIVGVLYDAFLEQYKIPEIKKNETTEQKSKREHKLRSLNALCVRLVFCLYAEDSGVFGKRNIFHDYLEAYDVRDCRKALIELFKVLDTPYSERDDYLEEDLAQFPYVNGGLFADESIEIPPFTDEIKDLLLTKASENFNWSEISPTIFGAVFESTLNPETRRSGGMHYTSIENIHKVIDPLFLDDLKEELEEVKAKSTVGGSRTKSLRSFQNKLASLKFFDPACGSGNFLTESFISIRRLENEVIRELDTERMEGQMSFSFVSDEDLNVKVSIQQFYGIEINDFAVSVAKTALWIAEAQMLSETKAFADIGNDFLPLKTYTNIVEGNALRIDWESVVPKSKLNYIMGNPPFRGHRLRSKSQIKDMEIMSDVPKYGKVDYVGAWFYNAAKYMQGTQIIAGFVSTNSICQGESVGSLWKYLTERCNVEIQYAHRTFVWENESSNHAAVHCVIVGFTTHPTKRKKMLFSDITLKEVDHINSYLQDAPDVFLSSRSKNLTPGMPKMHKGNEATDGGNLSLTAKERLEIISKYPQADAFIKKYVGSAEFINNKERYCIWLKGVSPSEYRSITPIMERLEKVKEFRANNVTPSVHKFAETPMLFAQLRQPETDFLLVPTVSSQRRRYIPMGFMKKDIIVNPKVLVVEYATLYLFGVLESNVHMAWMRVVTGRLKSDFEYYPSVYNNFPWCEPTPEQKDRIEKSAQGILDARALYPDSSLADLYDPLTMPPELRKAHIENDKAVMSAYGFSLKMSEEDCVAALMKMYQELV